MHNYKLILFFLLVSIATFPALAEEKRLDKDSNGSTLFLEFVKSCPGSGCPVDDYYWAASHSEKDFKPADFYLSRFEKIKAYSANKNKVP